MCQKCVDAVKRYYPDLPESDYGTLLLGATAFPFGGPDIIEKQLAEVLAASDGTLDGALAYAEREMDKAMAEGREQAGKE
jgi:hypothetical protein